MESRGNLGVFYLPSEDKATLTFVGQGIRIFGTQGPKQGIANVYIDEELKQIVDLYQLEKETDTMLYEIENLSDNVHTITIEVTGEKHPDSSGYYVEIDGIEVTP